MGMSLLTGLTISSSDTSSPEATATVVSFASASRTKRTLHLLHPSVLLQSHSCGITNLPGSVRSGISPSLCATASSCITDEFSSITTSSIARVETSLIANLLREFTYCLGILLNLTTILSFVFSTISADAETNILTTIQNNLKNLPKVAKILHHAPGQAYIFRKWMISLDDRQIYGRTPHF